MNIRVAPIESDPWRPIFTGPTLAQLKQCLSLPYPPSHTPDSYREPIRSIALVGAVREAKTGKLNLRDSALAGSLLARVAQNFTAQPDYKLEIFNLAEGSDIFAARGNWDILVFCNVRYLTENLVTHYNIRKAQNLLPEIKRGQAIVHPHDLDLHLREALTAAPTLSGIKFEGISPEHRNFVRVSESALQSDAYLNLAKRLKTKLILCWGWTHFIDAGHFWRDSRLELAKPDNQPNMQLDGYMRASSEALYQATFADLSAEAKAIMPAYPFVYAVIQHAVLQRMAAHEDRGSDPLIGEAFQTYAKLIAKAQRRRNLGLEPVAWTREVLHKDLPALQAAAAAIPSRWRMGMARIFGR